MAIYSSQNQWNICIFKKKMFGQILGQKKKFLYSQKSKLVGISKYIYL